MKDTEYYDKESGVYSLKRYVKSPISYTQYFFVRRLNIVLSLLGNFVYERGQRKSILEVGCADGYVIRSIQEKFPESFCAIAGVDISSGMIKVARKTYSSFGIDFLERKDFVSDKPLDIIIEIGVANYADIIEEIECAYLNISDTGYYVLSLAGQGSVWNLREGDNVGFKNFMSYREYEHLISRRFEIVKSRNVGLYLPLIWKTPALARIVQPIFEFALSGILPRLFHERIYVLRKKRIS